MNAVKKIIIAGAAIAALAVTLTANAKKNDNITIPDNAVIIDAEDLTCDRLVNRTPDEVIVARIVGECLDDNGNGKLVNDESEYNYISYRDVEGVQPGDIVITYEVYDRFGNGEDDIVERYDMIVASDDIER